MKRKKIDFRDFGKYGINYIAFQRVKNFNGVRGTRYILDKKLTPEQETAVRSWKNVTIGSATNRYAPEIKYNTVTLWERCI